MSQAEIQSVSPPVSPGGTAATFTFDRALLACNLGLSLLVAAALGGGWWKLARFEHELKAAQSLQKLELERQSADVLVGKKPHLKPDFTFRVSKLSAPTNDAPGTYLVAFTGKFANNGKAPFTLNKTGLSAWLGTPKQSFAQEPKAFIVNGPFKDTFLKWEVQERIDVGRPIDGRLLNPGEEALFDAAFWVTAAEGTFFGMGCHVYVDYAEEPGKTATVVWDAFHLLDLRSAEPQAR